MENNLLENTYESKNLLTRLYFRKKIDATIKLANLKKEDIILDFGCGAGWLERKLKNFNILGYDINPEKTFIKDYKKVKPTKIFCLDVFEHIPAEEIKKIINDFKNMGTNFELIVSIPTGNFISRKIRKLVGKEEVPKEHITSYEDILGILKENFKMRKKINFFTVTKMFVFQNQGK
ncbi:MAG: class I SAM-dependent methyltransferase [Candidatus Pacearchaeota archaeon]|nr:class I SAM-dependent methyltransferase [Candidatus Pacearchaeota archaeon]